jgi:MerR family mercuric resistance operon transcriptional regulator
MQEAVGMGLNTKSRAGAMTIGALSECTGVAIETIRYYERIGLLPAPPRSDGRHRRYDDAHRQRLLFIRRGRELGFSLDQVRDLLGPKSGADLRCDEVKSLTEAHIVNIRQKICDLRRLEQALTGLASQCSDDAVSYCPILEALSAK